MPVHRHKQDITPTPPDSTQEQSIPPLPDQKTFRQYLRDLARGAIRVVLEDVMREELDALIGVGWGESSPKRKGYRNCFYRRDLVTASGRLEDLKTQVFDRYSRYEPHIAEGLSQMFVAGTSTHKVGEVAQTLMGVAPSASTISRLNQSLAQQFESWRQRPLQEHWRILYLDGVHFSTRKRKSIHPLHHLAYPVPRWRPFQHSSWGQSRFHHHFDGVRGGSARPQRGARPACLC